MNWYAENWVGLLLLTTAAVLGLVGFFRTNLPNYPQKPWKNILWFFVVLCGTEGIVFLSIKNFAGDWDVQFDPFSVFVGSITAGLTLLLLHKQNQLQQKLVDWEAEINRPHLRLDFSEEYREFLLSHLPESKTHADLLCWVISVRIPDETKDRQNIIKPKERMPEVIPLGVRRSLSLEEVYSNSELEKSFSPSGGLQISVLSIYCQPITGTLDCIATSIGFYSEKFKELPTNDSTPITGSMFNIVYRKLQKHTSGNLTTEILRNILNNT